MFVVASTVARRHCLFMHLTLYDIVYVLYVIIWINRCSNTCMYIIIYMRKKLLVFVCKMTHIIIHMYVSTVC